MSDFLSYAASLDEDTGAFAPPVERWDPPDHGPIDIVIRSDGVWLHEGAPITRARLVKLFAAILQRDGDEFYLVTPAEKRRITVEDAPFIAVLLESARDRLTFTTNLRERVTAGPGNRITFREGRGDSREMTPYIEVRRGLDAKIARSVYYELADLGEFDDTQGAFGVRSRGVFFPFPDSAGA